MTPTEGTRVCSDHFTSGKHYYKCNSKTKGFSYVGWLSKDPRHPDYVPSVFSFSKPTDSSSKLARLARAQKRSKNDNMPVKKAPRVNSDMSDSVGLLDSATVKVICNAEVDTTCYASTSCVNC